jgi:hypothetical protein
MQEIRGIKRTKHFDKNMQTAYSEGMVTGELKDSLKACDNG